MKAMEPRLTRAVVEWTRMGRHASAGSRRRPRYRAIRRRSRTWARPGGSPAGGGFHRRLGGVPREPPGTWRRRGRRPRVVRRARSRVVGALRSGDAGDDEPAIHQEQEEHDQHDRDDRKRDPGAAAGDEGDDEHHEQRDAEH